MSNNVINRLQTRRVGLALSGGAVRGLAHIGVIKALTEADIQISYIAGTSAGSLVGAGFAAGMSWRELADMARGVFWLKLLNGRNLENFCFQYLPKTFSHLKKPFVAVATEMPARREVLLKSGNLASAISASCAIPLLRRPVMRDGLHLLDGGMVSVLPTLACRSHGADFILSSDVWEWSSFMRRLGHSPHGKHGQKLFPKHYQHAVHHTDILIQPSIPYSGYVPTAAAVERMIAVGELAAHRALSDWQLSEKNSIATPE